LVLFFSATGCMAAAMGVHESIFNNFLSDTFSLTADARGWLELPRELPGLLVVLMTGVLGMLAVTHLGVVGGVVFAAGMVGMAVWGGSYRPMLMTMITGSAGLHLLQPVGPSVSLGLSDAGGRGARLGQAGAVATAGTILGAGFVWLTFSKVAPQYPLGFLCAAGLGLLTAFMYSLMNIPHLRQPRARLVIRRRFAVFYLLELLAGARKQIFITFGPWVLIKVYHQQPQGIARLLITAAALGLVTTPLAGRAIDRFGERAVMIADGLLLIAVCLGYGYAGALFEDPDTARRFACGCYVADNLLFALAASRAVYVSRLAESPQEITSTLAMGVSLNHLVSMTMPIVAGALWVALGYERVFGAGALLALVIAAVSLLIPSPAALRRLEAQRGASAGTAGRN